MQVLPQHRVREPVLELVVLEQLYAPVHCQENGKDVRALPLHYMDG